MSDRAEKRRVLTPYDLTFIGQRLRILDPYGGVKPWDRDRLWAAVLDVHMEAETRADRESFRELVGALRVLDLLDRHFLRK
ncbi:hypothetical protein WME99_32390 [Sorangium sp. So ce136]|uniref:hypothetical protein n=1 Tax=Sorangium sp. So ce136 TaxID=3133284 RepID=UPI003F0082FB